MAILRAVPFLLLASVIHAYAAGLAVTSWQLHEYEDGPSASRSEVFEAGRTVYLSFQVSGFQKVEDHIHLSYEISTTDPSGRLLAPPKTGEIDTDLAPEDKRWLPKVRYQVEIPPLPEPGKHRIQARVTDQVSGGTAALAAGEFMVGGPAVQPAASLTVLNFRFLQSENDVHALPPSPVIKPGDTLWARFDLAGFKHGEKNRVDVSYGVALLDSQGKTLFSDPSAAADKDESFYPKTRVPGVIRLHLDPTIKPGAYSVAITATDAIGGQKTEASFPFVIR